LQITCRKILRASCRNRPPGKQKGDLPPVTVTRAGTGHERP